MAMLTVHHLPDVVDHALRAQAVLHGHSTETEVCDILINSVKSQTCTFMGDTLAALGQKIGLISEDFEVLEAS